MNFSSQVTVESEKHPGVRFTVRVLNKIQRARRDMPLVEPRTRLTELARRMAAIVAHDDEIAAIRRIAADEERDLAPDELATIEAIKNRPTYDEDIIRRASLDHECGLLIDLHLKPAYIRAGLISIEGLEIDGKPATADSLINCGTVDLDDLIDEIYLACAAESGLSETEQKNSPSPSRLSAVEVEGEKSTIASAA